MHIAARGGKFAFLLVETFAVVGDYALTVEHHYVLLASAEADVELGAANGSSASAVYHNFYIFDALASHFEGVEKSSRRDDGSAVLVVVHHRNVEFSLEATLYFEAFGSLDVLKVDTSKGWSNGFHGLDKSFGVFLVDFDVEDVDTAVDFEKQTLTLHHRLAADGANVAEAEHCGAVADHSHKVALAGVFIGVIGILLNLEARLSHAR